MLRLSEELPRTLVLLVLIGVGFVRLAHGQEGQRASTDRTEAAQQTSVRSTAPAVDARRVVAEASAAARLRERERARETEPEVMTHQARTRRAPKTIYNVGL